MLLGYLIARGQSYAAAFILVPIVQAVKDVEDPLMKFRLDADTIIPH